MTAVMHHAIHVPASVHRTAQRLEKLVSAVLFTLLPPLVFAVLILSGLLVATAVSKVL
jgi:hypothetical protein